MKKQSKTPSKNKLSQEIPVQSLLLAFAILLAALYAGFCVVTREDPAILETYAKSIGATMAKTKVLRMPDGALRVVATATVRRGDVVMSVPAESLITAQALLNNSRYAKALTFDKSQHIRTALMEYNADASFTNVFIYTFYIAMEKRDASSPLQPLFRELAPFSEADGALHWSEATAECLDSHAAEAVRLLWRGLSGSVAAAKAVCNADPELCGSAGPPTINELRWGMAVYLKFNYQDQAIIPMMMFARYNNSFRGLTVSFNQERQALDVIADTDAKKGEELFVNFPRGPGMQLVSRGFFDAASAGVDVNLDIKRVFQTKLGRKYCVERYHELMFGVDGKPREAAISCVALIMATEEQRRSFAEHRRNKDLMRGVYGSLREHLTHLLKDFGSGSSESCVVSPALRAIFDAYEVFVGDVLRRNLDHVNAMDEKLSA
jgi:hypothetical protein